jgi:hypothetical protein
MALLFELLGDRQRNLRPLLVSATMSQMVQQF